MTSVYCTQFLVGQSPTTSKIGGAGAYPAYTVPTPMAHSLTHSVELTHSLTHSLSLTVSDHSLSLTTKDHSLSLTINDHSLIDKGGSSVKTSFQTINTAKPNSVTNSCIFSLFEAPDCVQPTPSLGSVQVSCFKSTKIQVEVRN